MSAGFSKASSGGSPNTTAVERDSAATIHLFGTFDIHSGQRDVLVAYESPFLNQTFGYHSKLSPKPREMATYIASLAHYLPARQDSLQLSMTRYLRNAAQIVTGSTQACHSHQIEVYDTFDDWELNTRENAVRITNSYGGRKSLPMHLHRETWLEADGQRRYSQMYCGTYVTAEDRDRLKSQLQSILKDLRIVPNPREPLIAEFMRSVLNPTNFSPGQLARLSQANVDSETEFRECYRSICQEIIDSVDQQEPPLQLIHFVLHDSVESWNTQRLAQGVLGTVISKDPIQDRATGETVYL